MKALPAMIAGAVLAIGPDDRLYIGSANGVLTIKAARTTP